MERRDFLKMMAGGAAVSAVGCKIGEDAPPDDEPGGADAGAAGGSDAAPGTPDGGGDPAVDAGDGCLDAGYVVMYDTYAQALYMDGTLGPLTGTITVDYILANQEVDLDFWHGHGGQLHRFTIDPTHFAMLKQGERVYIMTTNVDGHNHMLFIDPTDPEYRVPGSDPVQVPLGDC